MSPGTFLLFNGLIVTILVVYFLFALKKRNDPTRLNLRKGNSPLHKGHALDHADNELNVLFNYNGHLWDAFEVLGIPAGSERDVVDRAYKQVLSSMEPGSRELIDMAYSAILERLGR